MNKSTLRTAEPVGALRPSIVHVLKMALHFLRPDFCGISNNSASFPDVGINRKEIPT